MSESINAPLRPGDLLHDLYNDSYLLLIRQYSGEEGNHTFEAWKLFDLTRGCDSWWYAASLENENEFRRV